MTKLTANARRAAAHMRNSGCSSKGVVLQAMSEFGAESARDIYIIAMSLALYGEGEVRDGARFTVEQGYGPQ